MIKKLCALCILGTASFSLVAQGHDTSPMYMGVTFGISQADLRSYQGGKSNGHGFELGYDFTKPEDFVGIRIFGRYTRWSGDYSERLELQQNLMSWGLGAEFMFQTPVAGLRPYLGAGLMWWDGRRDTESDYLARLRGADSSLGDPYVGIPYPAGPHGEGQAKAGLRFGLNYHMWKDFSVSLDYNVYLWRNDSINQPTTDHVIDRYALTGYNRINPSWLGLTLKYHFAMPY